MADHPGGYLDFADHTCIAWWDLPEVALKVRAALEAGVSDPVAVFDAATHAPVDLYLEGSPEEVKARAVELERALAEGGEGPRDPEGRRESQAPRGPGRPRLGVVGREVTLLPRHWDWLAAQPGGASVTLRKLVEGARKADQSSNQLRRTQDVAYRFMHALAGDLPGFEEVTRALYRWDLPRLKELITPWPQDVREHVLEIVGRTKVRGA